MSGQPGRTGSDRGAAVARRLVVVVATTVALLVGTSVSPAPASAAPPIHVGDCTGSASPARRWVSLVYIRALFRCDSGPDSEFGIMHFEPDSVRGTYTRAVFRSSEGSRKWVAQAYALFLGRNPDSSGSAFWTSHLISGTRYDAFESTLIGSNEYFAHAGATNAGFIDAVYLDLLDRHPGGAASAFWVQKLNSGSTRGSVALTIDRSAERRRDIADISGYGYILHRSASTSERNFWAAQQASGIDQLDLMAAFTASQEAISKANTVGF